MRKVLKNTYKSSSNCSNNRNIAGLLNIKSSSAVFHQWRRALGFHNRFCHIIRYDPRSRNVTVKHPRLSRQTSNLLTCRKPNSRRRVWWCQGAPRYNLCKLHSIYFHVNLQMYHNWLVYIYQFGRLSSVSFSLHPPKADTLIRWHGQRDDELFLWVMRLWKRNAREAQPGCFTKIRFWQEALSSLGCCAQLSSVVRNRFLAKYNECTFKQIRHISFIQTVQHICVQFVQLVQFVQRKVYVVYLIRLGGVAAPVSGELGKLMKTQPWLRKTFEYILTSI